MIHKSRGQSLIEFALLLPLLIFLILGFFDLGRAVFYLSTLNTAVREATRDAIVFPSTVYDSYIKGSTSELTSRIESSLGEFLYTKELKDACIPSQAGVCEVVPSLIPSTPPPTDPSVAYDPKVQVTITYQYKAITPGLAALIGGGGTIPITVNSEMLLAPYAKPSAVTTP